jgi:hypothetical protein
LGEVKEDASQTNSKWGNHGKELIGYRLDIIVHEKKDEFVPIFNLEDPRKNQFSFGHSEIEPSLSAQQTDKQVKAKQVSKSTVGYSMEIGTEAKANELTSRLNHYILYVNKCRSGAMM